MFKHFSFLSFSLIIIKLFAIFKDSLIASNFGSSRELDLLFLAMLIPAFFQNLISSGLSVGFIPFYQEKFATYGKKSSDSFFIIFLLLAFIIVIILSFFIFNTKILALKYLEITSEFDIAIFLSIFNYSIIIFILGTLSKIIQQFLFLKKQFFISSATESFIPLSVILFLLFNFEKITIYNLIYGFLTGYLLQFFILLYLLFKEILFRIEFYYKDIFILKNILMQSLYIFIGGSLSYLNFSVDSFMCSNLSPGSLSILNYSNKIPALIISFFTMSIGNIFVSYYSDINSKNTNIIDYKKFLFVSIISGLIIFCVFFMLIPYIVSLLYYRGNFTSYDLNITIKTVKAYSLQLIVFTNTVIGIKILNIQKKSFLLGIIGVLSFILNILFNILLIKYNTVGLALSTSIVYIFSCIVLNIFVIKGIKSAKNQKKVLE
ncbi:MAG: polysaccharide biosynthesis C-terminal domain-containing protein [Candidatus Muirbacterium halophilum]|nr:polysaccharide biosynthesis C-terminal domain-containing protein [Candidatus Muirbacterium halophilum]MCK9474969.1 polysaccharide biosynthesis C-terminal domain-containing protein [Candidatus Muirbacterium halophilum]